MKSQEHKSSFLNIEAAWQFFPATITYIFRQITCNCFKLVRILSEWGQLSAHSGVGKLSGGRRVVS